MRSKVSAVALGSATALTERGYSDAAFNLYTRASTAYALAQYNYFYFGDDPRRAAFAAAAGDCVEELAKHFPGSIERIAVPFVGHQVVALTHLTSTRANQFSFEFGVGLVQWGGPVPLSSALTSRALPIPI